MLIVEELGKNVDHNMFRYFDRETYYFPHFIYK